MSKQWTVANEMRVILCALITAHKREDTNAFWATVEIAKTVVGKYAELDDEDWAVFRGDSARKDEHPTTRSTPGGQKSLGHPTGDRCVEPPAHQMKSTL